MGDMAPAGTNSCAGTVVPRDFVGILCAASGGRKIAADLVTMLEDSDDKKGTEPDEDEGEGLHEHPWRTTILPPMPTWMAEGKRPPQSAIVPGRRPVRSVVFEFESIACADGRCADRRVA